MFSYSARGFYEAAKDAVWGSGQTPFGPRGRDRGTNRRHAAPAPGGSGDTRRRSEHAKAA